MTTTSQLKGAIIALVSLASAEEQMLLGSSPVAEPGSVNCWAALPLVAHNTEFKRQQVERLRAVALGVTPAEFAEVDHSSAELYRSYATQPQQVVAQDSLRVAGELVDGVRSVSAENLTDPSRNPWLVGRALWLQIIVRGFWHPTGHLIGYYLSHSQADRAVALAAHGVATARYAGAPEPARGMASYNLACAHAAGGDLGQAAEALGEAVRLNPAVRGNADRDPDLAALRDNGVLASVLAAAG